MRCVLSIPPPLADRWRADSDTRIVSTSIPPMRIRVGELGPLPDDRTRWISDVMSADAPAHSRFESGRLHATTTDNGWPVRLMSYHFVDEAETIVEFRLGVFYRFFEYGAAAVATYAAPQLDVPLADEAKQIFASAEPDFSSAIVAVHQLWEGAEQ